MGNEIDRVEMNSQLTMISHALRLLAYQEVKSYPNESFDDIRLSMTCTFSIDIMYANTESHKKSLRDESRHVIIPQGLGGGWNRTTRS